MNDPRIAWTAAIREPELASAWTLAEWEFVVRLARRLRLLARLAESLDQARLLERVPNVVRRHLVAERQVSRFRTAALVWALERIRSTLGPVPYPCVLLKGAAYAGQNLPIAHGRLPTDVDVLVPRSHLDSFQRALVADGWSEVALDAHDQRYYREYSHELPPMRHPLHAIELDVHHDILPPLARTRVDIGLMLERVEPSVWPGWCVLQPTDQVLHSAAHLFFDSQARDRLRDLVDLDGLLRHFGQRDPGFFDELVARATQIGLAQPLALAVHFCARWLGTPIQAGAMHQLQRHRPGGAQRWWLMPTLAALLWPAHPDAPSPRSQRVAAALFLARYHASRLPLGLLVPHLMRKLRARIQSPSAPPDTAGGALG